VEEVLTIFGYLAALATAGGLAYLLIGWVHISLRKMERRAKLPPAPTGDVAAAEVQERLAELDDLRIRLAEVEERLDFAERALVKGRDAERLPPPR
jgi:hypothetical protein